MELTYNDTTIELRPLEWGDTENIQPSRIARVVGNTVKALHREHPVTRFYTGTSRGNCVDDIIDFLDLTLGDIIIIEEEDYVIHEGVTITEDHTGYNVTFVLEKLCS